MSFMTVSTKRDHKYSDEGEVFGNSSFVIDSEGGSGDLSSKVGFLDSFFFFDKKLSKDILSPLKEMECKE
jgi:hypothetical protein